MTTAEEQLESAVFDPDDQEADPEAALALEPEDDEDPDVATDDDIDAEDD